MPASRLLYVALLFSPLAPAGAQTFVDRLQPDDFRVVSYNVLWDTIFPSEDPVQAAKFERVVAAVDADVWCLQEIGFSTSIGTVTNLMNAIAPLPGGGSWYGHKAGDCVIVSKHPMSFQASTTLPAGDKDLAMALVDLPDALFATDLYLMNNHYKCCGGFDDKRQKQSDAIVNWMRDAREPGQWIDLPAGTPMVVLGDLNIVDGPQPLQTLIDGDIQNEAWFGADSPPDWDASDSSDVGPLHNVSGPDDWTWFSPGPFPHGRLDYVIVTDSVIETAYAFVLNTTTMSSAELAATGLQANDVTVDSSGVDFDHVPLIVDFRGSGPADPWTDLGSALAGTHGEPQLDAEGTLLGGDPVTLTLSNALESTTTTLIIGFSALGVPFKGGVLHPAPDLLADGLAVDGSGNHVLAGTWPVGVPSGTTVVLQHWIVDGAGPAGLASSNGVSALTP